MKVEQVTGKNNTWLLFHGLSVSDVDSVLHC